MTRDTFVPLLSQLIGRQLLNFLDGIDAINFIEAVNNSEQFWSLADTSDYTFLKSINMFCGKNRINLCPTFFEYYQDDCDIDEHQCVLIPKKYSKFIQPSIRLFAHPCFSVDGFRKLSKLYKTPLFQCYSRLLPFNTVKYCADFDLFNYELYSSTIGSSRFLNEHEKKLFKGKFGTMYSMRTSFCIQSI